jgi:hypothetical protein
MFILVYTICLQHTFSIKRNGNAFKFFKKLSNITSHINRLGKYSIDKTIKIPELIFDIELKKIR